MLDYIISWSFLHKNLYQKLIKLNRIEFGNFGNLLILAEFDCVWYWLAFRQVKDVELKLELVGIDRLDGDSVLTRPELSELTDSDRSVYLGKNTPYCV